MLVVLGRGEGLPGVRDAKAVKKTGQEEWGEMRPNHRLLTVLPQSEYEATGHHAVITLLGSASKVDGERLYRDGTAAATPAPTE
jgi:hypothetical protein